MTRVSLKAKEQEGGARVSTRAGQPHSTTLTAPQTRPSDLPPYDEVDDVFLPDPVVWKRYGVTAMTGWRWDNDPDMGFPPPYVIANRKYRKLSELREFERRCVVRTREEKAKA
jgi:hypothetical protein